MSYNITTTGMFVTSHGCDMTMAIFFPAQDDAEGNFKFDGSSSRNPTPPVKTDKRDRDKERLVCDMAAAGISNLDVAQ